MKDKMPSPIHPMLGVLVKKPFDREGWVFEIKWDGYRAIAEINKGNVKLYSRNQLSFNSKFPQIITELQQWTVESAVLDGELVILDNTGRSQFQEMQNYQRTQTGTVIYCIFDLLYLNGRDLRALPLIERKGILEKLLKKMPHQHLHYSEHVAEKGIAYFKKAAAQHLEGIMAKNGQSAYTMSRSSEWIKIKSQMRQEFVIGGYTEPRRSRLNFGSLLIGVYQQGKLQYCGHVGGGFSRQSLSTVYEKLVPLIRKTSPFTNAPNVGPETTWVKPQLVCEVSFAEWTDEGILRQPVFHGLRIDKEPKDVKREEFSVTQRSSDG